MCSITVMSTLFESVRFEQVDVLAVPRLLLHLDSTGRHNFHFQRGSSN